MPARLNAPLPQWPKLRQARSQSWPGGRGGLCLLAALAAHTAAWAGDVTTFRTNYYQVTGATLLEVRQAIARARPWKERAPMDARTDWTVQWKHHVDHVGGVARVLASRVETTITITLPSWKPPDDVAPEVVEQWKRYFSHLKRHEEGHVAIALQAAAEVRRRLNAISEAPTIAELQRLLDRAARQAVEEFQAKDREYDRITQHGARQEAWRP